MSACFSAANYWFAGKNDFERAPVEDQAVPGPQDLVFKHAERNLNVGYLTWDQDVASHTNAGRSSDHED